MVGHAQSYRVLTAGYLVDHPAPTLQDHGKRAGPAGLGQLLGPSGHGSRPIAQLLAAGEVNDQGVGVGTLLGAKNAPERLWVAGVGTEAVDRLGGKGDEAAATQQLDSLGDRLGIGAPG